MAQIMGNLAADALVKQVNDQNVVEFTVAENYEYTNKQGHKSKKTCYFHCSYWNREKLAPYLKKGTAVIIKGYVSANAYENKRGELQAQINLTVTDFDWPPSSPKNQDRSTPVETPAEEQADDLPF